jgi:hypothetical protein
MQKAAVAFFDYNEETGGFEFNQDNYNKFISSNGDVNDMERQTENKLNNMSIESQQKWLKSSKSYMLNAMDYDTMNKFQNRFIDAFHETQGYENFSAGQILELFGVQSSPMRDIYTNAQLFYGQDNGALRSKMDALGSQEEMLARINANRVGIIGELKNKWEGFKDVVGDTFQPFSDAMTDFSVAVQDKLYGKKFSRIGIHQSYDFSNKGINDEINGLKDTLEGLADTFSELESKGVAVDSQLKKSLSPTSFNIKDYNVKDDFEEVFRTTFKDEKGLEDELKGLSGGMKEKFKLLKDLLPFSSARSAMLLPNGKALISGVQINNKSSNHTYLFAPKTDKFEQGPDMIYTRLNFTAALLPSD